MKRALLVLIFLGGLMTTESFAQDNMGIGTSTPEPSAVLDLDATDKGFLVPRLNTVQRTNIASPATGLMVYDTDDNKFWYFDGIIWVQSVGPAGADGADGADGTDGADGADGAQGPAGTDGTNGTDGADGADGAQGPAGIDGTNGTDGADGADGAQGPAGIDGTNGTDGADGADGAQGPAGIDGTNGTDGAQGPAGAQGPVGVQGPVGAQGPQGLIGPAGPINQVVGGYRAYGTITSTATNGAWVNTGVAVTVTTHGEPVFVSLTGHMAAFADYVGLSVRRDGGLPEIATGFQTGFDYYWYGTTEQTVTVSGVDLTAPAGSHSYSIWMFVSDGGTGSYLWNTNLSVLEVNNQ